MRPSPQRTTLCFVFDPCGAKLLMIEKKRGQGAGKINVPGGKQQAGETLVETAKRECFEETGITPLGLKIVGRLEFLFAPSPDSNLWDNLCEVYQAESFLGEVQPENDECRAFWCDVGAIPFEKMWADDRLWFPQLLAGKIFHRVYHFDSRGELLSEENLDESFAQTLRSGA